MPVRFNKVSNGIYRGGVPSTNDLNILHDVFNIETILSLDHDIASGIAPHVKSLGMTHIIIPISGNSANLSYLQSHIVSTLDENKPIYVHCRHGSDRTGLAIALYRINHDGWSNERAFQEAKSYGFGDRLEGDVKNIYENIIKTAEDDIVGEMRDQFDIGRVAPAYLPQQSFAPEGEIKFLSDSVEDVPPMVGDHSALNPNSQYPESKKEKRTRELRLLILKELEPNMAPQVGNYDNFDGIRGAGPLAGDDENSGGFMYDEQGGLPGGAGVSNTGGFTNL